MIEKELIASCKKGNKKAFGQMYTRCIAYVYSIVRRYIEDAEDAKDIIQEVFAKVFVNLKSYDARKGKWNTWIRKITVNECLMHIRRTKNLSILVPIENIAELQVADSIDLGKLRREDIDLMLGNMPEGYRIIFMLYVIDEYDHSQISKMLGISNATSRSQLNRAKKWLRNQILEDHKYKAYGLF